MATSSASAPSTPCSTASGNPLRVSAQRDPRRGAQRAAGPEPDVGQPGGPEPPCPDRGRDAPVDRLDRVPGRRRCGERSRPSTASMTRCASPLGTAVLVPRSTKRRGWPDDGRPASHSLQAGHRDRRHAPVSRALEAVLEAVSWTTTCTCRRCSCWRSATSTARCWPPRASRSGTRSSSRAPRLGEAATKPLITGEVTALEAEYDALGGRAVVRGYDPSHRLHRGRQTQTYRNVTDSDIARTVAPARRASTSAPSRSTHDLRPRVAGEHLGLGVPAQVARAAHRLSTSFVEDGKLMFRRRSRRARRPARATSSPSTRSSS